MSKFSSFWKKLKSIKNIEIILAVLIGLVVLLVFFSSSGAQTGVVNNTQSASSTYVSEIEYKLENLISRIEGAGVVEVMIMCEEEETLENPYPKVVSAVVVSSGADSTKVKLDIIRAVEALLGVKTANIEVLKGSG